VFLLIVNLVSSDFIIIMYQLEFMPNSYEIVVKGYTILLFYLGTMSHNCKYSLDLGEGSTLYSIG
jgi:hypothetical protein